MQQGSYMLIVPGMAVHATDGGAGSVTEVVADTSVDVFRGIVVSHGLLPHKHSFVPGDLVEAVTDDGVRLSVSKRELDLLPEPQAKTSDPGPIVIAS